MELTKDLSEIAGCWLPPPLLLSGLIELVISSTKTAIPLVDNSIWDYTIRVSNIGLLLTINCQLAAGTSFSTHHNPPTVHGGSSSLKKHTPNSIWTMQQWMEDSVKNLSVLSLERLLLHTAPKSKILVQSSTPLTQLIRISGPCPQAAFSLSTVSSQVISTLSLEPISLALAKNSWRWEIHGESKNTLVHGTITILNGLPLSRQKLVSFRQTMVSSGCSQTHSNMLLTATKSQWYKTGRRLNLHNKVKPVKHSNIPWPIQLISK